MDSIIQFLFVVLPGRTVRGRVSKKYVWTVADYTHAYSGRNSHSRLPLGTFETSPYHQSVFDMNNRIITVHGAGGNVSYLPHRAFRRSVDGPLWSLTGGGSRGRRHTTCLSPRPVPILSVGRPPCPSPVSGEDT